MVLLFVRRNPSMKVFHALLTGGNLWTDPIFISTANIVSLLHNICHLNPLYWHIFTNRPLVTALCWCQIGQLSVWIINRIEKHLELLPPLLVS